LERQFYSTESLTGRWGPISLSESVGGSRYCTKLLVCFMQRMFRAPIRGAISFVTAALAVAACATVAHATPLTISESGTAPSGNILASQLTASSGAQDNTHDYTDNGGPPGETFTVSHNATLSSFTILGRGDAGGGSSGATWNVQIGSVNPSTGVITQLDNESATFSYSAANDYLTFGLGNPVSLTAGNLYSFSVFTSAGYYGLAHSNAGSSLSNEYGVNNDQSLGQAGNAAPARTFNGVASPNPSGYIYTFAAQGSLTVPEPASTTLVLIGVAGLALIRRRLKPWPR
jgi:hypothetical protein